MESNIFYLFLAIGIGGLIGGGTNLLAIRMLFRPHRPMYISRYRIPFTPGVIPNKQKQLAEKIASVVSDYILTPEAISQGLKKTGLTDALKKGLTAQWNKLQTDNQPVAVYLDKIGVQQEDVVQYVSKAIHRQLIKTNVKPFMANKVDQFIALHSDIPINDMVPKVITESLEHNIHPFVANILKGLSKHLQEDSTKITIIQMIDQALDVKNPLLRKLLFGLISDVQIQDQFIQKIQKLIESDAIHKHIEQHMQTKLQGVLSSSIHDLQTTWPDESSQLQTIVSESLHKGIQQALHSDELTNSLEDEIRRLIAKLWDTPVAKIHRLSLPYMDTTIDWLANKIINHMEDNLDELLKIINIYGLVEEQVLSFPSETLERMILQVAKKELQYITYIGVVIGGLMGVIQYLIIYNTLP